MGGCFLLLVEAINSTTEEAGQEGNRKCAFCSSQPWSCPLDQRKTQNAKVDKK
jgi:hypothetical protein